MNEIQPADVQCPECEGDGCEYCDEGFFKLTECPSRYIGNELISDIQIVSASEHHLPVAGGLLDQSAWWFELRDRLKRDEMQIKAEREQRQTQ